MRKNIIYKNKKMNYFLPSQHTYIIVNNNKIMSTPIYYALWYRTLNNEISANAISANESSLYKLHEESILNPECLYHSYKKNIFEIIVDKIMCYKYNNISKKIEILNNTDELNNGAFYAMNNYPFINNNIYTAKEVLIYLTKEDHEIWRRLSNDKESLNKIDSEYPLFFYEELVSLNIVQPDTYYEESIMNS